MQEFLTEPATPLYPEEKYTFSQNEKEDFMEKFRNIWKEIFLKYSDTESKLGIININHQDLDGLYSESEGCIYNFISGRSLSYLSRSLMAYIQLGLYNLNILHKCIDGLVGAGSCQFSDEQGKRYRETLYFFFEKLTGESNSVRGAFQPLVHDISKDIASFFSNRENSSFLQTDSSKQLLEIVSEIRNTFTAEKVAISCRSTHPSLHRLVWLLLPDNENSLQLQYAFCHAGYRFCPYLLHKAKHRYRHSIFKGSTPKKHNNYGNKILSLFTCRKRNILRSTKQKAAFNQVKVLFDDDLGHFTGCFTDTIFNVVMDFEVNSRLFSEEEWEFMQVHTRTLLQNDTIGGQWPLDYGFPLGKTWNEYLNMILLNIKDFITYFRIESKIKQMRRDEGFNGIISESTYKKIKKNCEGKKFSLRELHDFERLSHAHSSEYAIPHGSMNDYTRGNFLEPTKVCFIGYTNMKDLLGKVKKLLIVKGRAPLLRNQFYNTNRRRYSTNVIIPKTVKYNTTKRPNLYLLFDISGSVDAKMVHDFFLTFQRVKQEFTHTKIVFWTDHFNGECTLEDKIPDYYGGGTDIASGITYINTKYNLKKKDVFFVISDFCDNLEDWKVALKKMECKLYAINWNSKQLTLNPGFEKILINSPVSHSA